MALCVLSAILLSSCTNTSASTTSDVNAAATTTAPAVQSTAVTTDGSATQKPDAEKEAYTILKGKMNVSKDRVVAGTSGVLAVMNDTMLRSGAFSANITANTNSKTGLIFGYSQKDNHESYYRFGVNKGTQQIELELVTNGVAQKVYSNYLSAGYSAANEYTYKVVIEESTAYCYFWDILYVVREIEQMGDGIGLYAESQRAVFKNITVSQGETRPLADTLIYGHSYIEMWNNWKTDVAPIAEEFELGTVAKAGIGGSVAAHWDKLKESLVAYGATTGIYMIGINDLTGGTSPASVVASIKNTLLYVKEAIPEYQVILLSVNHCPARSTIRSQISETNRLMRNLSAQYDWISYAEMEYEFCDDGLNPAERWFIDALHPTTAGYAQKMVPAIRSALLGEDQPTLNDELTGELLENAKAVKYCLLTDYRESAFRAQEWALAKPLYDAAIEKIEACQTAVEVEALDLSSYITELDQIKSVGDYSFEELRSGVNCTMWETPTFKQTFEQSKDGVYSIAHDGHRLNNTTLYSDMTFKFKLSDITGEFATAGVLFRAKQLDTLGVQGYYINIVTEPNYIQIWYFEDCYGTANKTLQYIGGWVFPGEVENTEFRAVVKGDAVYIYTEEDYVSKGESAYGCSVDLSFDGQFEVFDYGSYGILCWNSYNGATGKLAITDIQGTVYAP